MHQAASERKVRPSDELLRAIEAKDYGWIIWYYRTVIIGWTATELGELYGFMTKNKPYTGRWVQLVESNSDKVPMDEERRRVLAAILNIPLTYLAACRRETSIPSLVGTSRL